MQLLHTVIFCCVSAAGWLFASNATLAAKNVRFQSFTLEDGLTQNSVLAIEQDHLGFLWFGTEDGLNRYDGYEFTYFRHHAKDPLSIADNRITCLLVDQTGTLWVGTWGGGVGRFIAESEGFDHQLYDPDGTNCAGLNTVRSMAIDRAGNLWVGTHAAGLVRLHIASRHLSSYIHDANDRFSLSSDHVRAIEVDQKGIVWVGTKDGLNRFDPECEGFTHYRHNPDDVTSLSHNQVYAIEKDETGLWVGTSGGGLNYFRNGKFSRYPFNRPDSKSLSHQDVTVIYKDTKSRVWIGTDGGGLNELDLDRQTFLKHQKRATHKNCLSSDLIYSAFEDGSGNIWVGTEGGGVNRLDGGAQPFHLVQHDPDSANSLTSNMVFPIIEDSLGDLWIGSKGGGLNHWSSKKQKFEHYLPVASDPNSLAQEDIFALAEDKHGFIWIGTTKAGLQRFDRRTKNFRSYLHDPDNPKSISGDQISIIAPDRQGNLWIGTNGKGLNRYDLSTQEFERFRFDVNHSSSLSDDRIFSIFVDKHETVWVGTNGSGLCRYEGEGQFSRFRNSPTDPASISHDVVLCMSEDQLGRLWVGTSYGLNLMDVATGTFQHWTTDQGLPNDVIYGILEDRNHRLWMSTNRGLAVFELESGLFETYDFHDGLQGDEFNFASYCQGSDGLMYFGGIQGISVFDPDHIETSEFEPPIYVTDLLLANQHVLLQRFEASSPLPKPIPLVKNLKLSPKQNMFSLSFSALDFVDPAKNEYAYRLTGYNDQWILTDAQNRRATYTNLSPGHYVFQVKGTNRDGVWSSKTANVRITILPFWWQKAWVRLIAVMLFICLLAYSYRRRVQGLLRIERLRTRIARDLHDDVGAALTNISVMANMVREGHDQDGSYLSHIEESSRNLVGSMRDLVWSMDSRYDSLTDLLARMKASTDSILTNIDCRFSCQDLDMELKVPPNTKQNLFLIFKEAISNSLKHSGASIIKIHMQRRSQTLVLSIHDNGTGLRESELDSGNGIKNMKWRAHILDGNAQITNENGVRVQIQVPLPLRPGLIRRTWRVCYNMANSTINGGWIPKNFNRLRDSLLAIKTGSGR